MIPELLEAEKFFGLASAFENIKPVYNDLGNLCALDIDGKQIAIDALAAALTQAGLEVLSGNSLVAVEKATGTGVAPPASNDVLDSVFELPDDISGITDGGTSALDTTEVTNLFDDMPEFAGSTRDKLQSAIQSEDLSRIADELYRPGATVGDGGTATKLTQEFYDGTSTHLIKAKERLTQLNNLAESGTLNLNDLDILNALRADLESAIKLFT